MTRKLYEFEEEELVDAISGKCVSLFKRLYGYDCEGTRCIIDCPLYSEKDIKAFVRGREEGCPPKEENKPDVGHYNRLDPEPIDVIRAWDLDFCLGNVVKYVSRCGHKDGEPRTKDLQKAIDYLKFELEKEGRPHDEDNH